MSTSMLHTHILISFLAYCCAFAIFFRGSSSNTFVFWKAFFTFSSLLTPQRSIVTNKIDRRSMVTLSRLLIWGIINFFASFRRNKRRLWVFPTSNLGFWPGNTIKLFSVATSSKLYNIDKGYFFVCRLQLYEQII